VVTPQASVEEIWGWLRNVPDPEIPVISVVDLGIVRDVRWENDQLVVRVTPTYSGCPATSVIAQDIKSALHSHGVKSLRLETELSPPWTTEWISSIGHEKLRAFGIAPPAAHGKPSVCPRCASANVNKVSEFGSTPCKAQYQCRDCLEPFDLFKCI
jgi:ring-1,2-phenylacetyl-CoA epoxidase subunit PaaD